VEVEADETDVVVDTEAEAVDTVVVTVCVDDEEAVVAVRNVVEPEPAEAVRGVDEGGGGLE